MAEDTGCFRLTFRMLPHLEALQDELVSFVKAGRAVPSSSAAAAATQPLLGKAALGAAYFGGAVPSTVWLQAGAWDRSLGCLPRAVFAQRLEDVALHLARLAPSADLVLGTLPYGSAYPADPTAEAARARANTPGDANLKVGQKFKASHTLAPQGWARNPRHSSAPPAVPLLLSSCCSLDQSPSCARP